MANYSVFVQYFDDIGAAGLFLVRISFVIVFIRK